MPCQKNGKYVLTEWNRNDEKLIQAVKKGSLNDVQQLLVDTSKRKADPVKLDPNRGTTALHVTASRGLVTILDHFLRLPIDSDVRDIQGRTPLHCAVRNARHDVTKRLIQHGAEVNAVDHDLWSALHHGCFGGHLGCIQLLLSAASPAFLKDKQGRSALLLAAWKGQASICRLLIENGADVNDTDNDGRTALMLAAEKGNTAVCNYLIARGADINLTDKNGHDAIWLSREHNKPEVTKVLQKRVSSVKPPLDGKQSTKVDVHFPSNNRYHHYDVISDVSKPVKPKRRSRSRSVSLESHQSVDSMSSLQQPAAVSNQSAVIVSSSGFIGHVKSTSGDPPETGYIIGEALKSTQKSDIDRNELRVHTRPTYGINHTNYRPVKPRRLSRSPRKSENTPGITDYDNYAPGSTDRSDCTSPCTSGSNHVAQLENSSDRRGSVDREITDRSINEEVTIANACEDDNRFSEENILERRHIVAPVKPKRLPRNTQTENTDTSVKLAKPRDDDDVIISDNSDTSVRVARRADVTNIGSTDTPIGAACRDDDEAEDDVTDRGSIDTSVRAASQGDDEDDDDVTDRGSINTVIKTSSQLRDDVDIRAAAEISTDSAISDHSQKHPCDHHDDDDDEDDDDITDRGSINTVIKISSQLQDDVDIRAAVEISTDSAISDHSQKHPSDHHDDDYDEDRYNDDESVFSNIGVVNYSKYDGNNSNIDRDTNSDWGSQRTSSSRRPLWNQGKLWYDSLVAPSDDVGLIHSPYQRQTVDTGLTMASDDRNEYQDVEDVVKNQQQRINELESQQTSLHVELNDLLQRTASLELTRQFLDSRCSQLESSHSNLVSQVQLIHNHLHSVIKDLTSTTLEQCQSRDLTTDLAASHDYHIRTRDVLLKLENICEHISRLANVDCMLVNGELTCVNCTIYEHGSALLKTNRKRTEDSIVELQTENEQLRLKLQQILKSNEMSVEVSHVERCGDVCHVEESVDVRPIQGHSDVCHTEERIDMCHVQGHFDVCHVEGCVDVDCDHAQELVEVAKELADENEALLADFQHYKDRFMMSKTWQEQISDVSRFSDDVTSEFQELVHDATVASDNDVTKALDLATTTEKIRDYTGRDEKEVNKDFEKQKKFELLSDQKIDRPRGFVSDTSSVNLDKHGNCLTAETVFFDDDEHRSSVVAGVGTIDDVSLRASHVEMERSKANNISISKITGRERTSKSREDVQTDYKAMYEELLRKVLEMQIRLKMNSALHVEFKRVAEENEEMVEMIIELRAQVERKCGEVSALTRKVTELEKQLITQIEDFSSSLRRLMNKSDTTQSESESRAVSDLNESPVVWTIGSDSVVSDAESELERGGSTNNVVDREHSSMGASTAVIDSRLIYHETTGIVNNTVTYEDSDNEADTRDIGLSMCTRDTHSDTQVARDNDNDTEVSDSNTITTNRNTMGCSTTSRFSLKLDDEYDVIVLRNRVEDLLEEVEALKKTVLEQGRYLVEQGRYLVNVEEQRVEKTDLISDSSGSLAVDLNINVFNAVEALDDGSVWQQQQTMLHTIRTDVKEIEHRHRSDGCELQQQKISLAKKSDVSDLPQPVMSPIEKSGGNEQLEQDKMESPIEMSDGSEVPQTVMSPMEKSGGNEQPEQDQMESPIEISDGSELIISTNQLCEDHERECSTVFRSCVNIVVAASSQMEVFPVAEPKVSVHRAEILQGIDACNKSDGNSENDNLQATDCSTSLIANQTTSEYQISNDNTRLKSENESCTQFERKHVTSSTTQAINEAFIRLDEMHMIESRNSTLPNANEVDNKSTFDEAAVLFLNRVSCNLEPSGMKRAWSESDLSSSRAVGQNYEQLQAAGSHDQIVDADDDNLKQKSPQMDQVECRQVARSDFDESDVNRRAQIAAEAETVRKYTALVNSLRRTCQLVNSCQMEKINCEEDYLSVEELLLLVDSYEQIVSDKNSLEDENRVLIMELDRVTARHSRTRADSKSQQDRGALSAIVEESLKEEIAELQYELEMMDREVEDTNKALIESRQTETRLAFLVEQLRNQLHELHRLVSTRYLEAVSCSDTERQKVDNCSQTGIEDNGCLHRILDVDSERCTSTQEDSCINICDKLRVNTQTGTKSLECNYQSTLPEEEMISMELRTVNKNPVSVDIADRFNRLRETTSWVGQRISSSEEADSMFCLQERLATEIEQLSYELHNKEAELEDSRKNCRYLEDHCQVLEKDNCQLVHQLCAANEHRRNDLGKRVPTDALLDLRKHKLTDISPEIYGQLLDKLVRLQITNSRLIDERTRLVLDLKTEIENNGSACAIVKDFLNRVQDDDNVNNMVADDKSLVETVQTSLHVGKCSRDLLLFYKNGECESNKSADQSNSTNMDVDSSLGCQELVIQMHNHNARLRDFISVLEKHFTAMATDTATVYVHDSAGTTDTSDSIASQSTRQIPESASCHLHQQVQSDRLHFNVKQRRLNVLELRHSDV